MIGYAIYGKIIEPIVFKGKIIEPQKQFRPLNIRGVRVNKISDAAIYYSESQAKNFLNSVEEDLKRRGKDRFVTFEIRKVNV